MKIILLATAVLFSTMAFKVQAQTTEEVQISCEQSIAGQPSTTKSFPVILQKGNVDPNDNTWHGQVSKSIDSKYKYQFTLSQYRRTKSATSWTSFLEIKLEIDGAKFTSTGVDSVAATYTPAAGDSVRVACSLAVPKPMFEVECASKF